MILGNITMKTPPLFMDQKYLSMTSPTRLLVAMPEMKTRANLQTYFENMGQEVKVTGTADKILGIARLWQPHVILVSDELQNKPVHEIFQELLTDARTSHIPLMLICNENDKLSQLAILEMGVGDIITRPVDLEELRWRIAAVRRWSSLSKS